MSDVDIQVLKQRVASLERIIDEMSTLIPKLNARVDQLEQEAAARSIQEIERLNT